jgi:lambda repressor-like predicted transcriptional regulator
MKRYRPITPEQLIAGRALAGLTMRQLAQEAGTTRQTIWRFCYRGSDTVQWLLENIREVLERHGVVLIAVSVEHGPGVAKVTGS